LVKLADGKEYDAKVVGRDPKTDLTLIKIEGGSNLQPLEVDLQAPCFTRW